MTAVGTPLPLAGEGDHAQRGGGGGHRNRRVGPPPSVGFAATFPRTREKDPTEALQRSSTCRVHVPRCGMTELRYPVLIEPLSEEDGGGFLATVPDLPGCMSDGETPAEAIENVQDAIEEWLDLARKLGREIPVASKVTEVA